MVFCDEDVYKNFLCRFQVLDEDDHRNFHNFFLVQALLGHIFQIYVSCHGDDHKNVHNWFPVQHGHISLVFGNDCKNYHNYFLVQALHGHIFYALISCGDGGQKNFQAQALARLL